MRTAPRSATKLKLCASPALISPERSTEAWGGTFSALQLGETAGINDRNAVAHSNAAMRRAANSSNPLTKRRSFMQLSGYSKSVLLVIPRVQLAQSRGAA